MYVVAVDFRIHPKHLQAFMPLMLAQARNSLANEPGCQCFDVCQNPDTPDQVFLYEVYDDRAAFDAHMVTDHYRNFDRAVSDMVAEKQVRFFHRQDAAASGG